MAKKASVKEKVIEQVLKPEIIEDEYIWLVGTGNVIEKGKVFRQTKQGAKILIDAGRAELKK